jgi:hypothetical protein
VSRSDQSWGAGFARGTVDAMRSGYDSVMVAPMFEP